MLDKLAEINVRFEKLTDELGQPNVVQDQERFRKLSQEHSGMQDIVECYRSYLEIQQELDDNRDLAAAKDEDPEIREMAEQEILQLDDSWMAWKNKSSCYSFLKIQTIPAIL